MGSIPQLRVPLLACLVLAGATLSARADTTADKAAIAARLRHWAEAFNARDAAGVCDLFAPGLVSSVPGAVDIGRDAVCRRLAATLAKPGLKLHYTPDIREIIVSGNLAVVRLFWTLTVQEGTRKTTGREAGLDVFQKQPDGRWSIIRFMAFSLQPQAARPAPAGKP